MVPNATTWLRTAPRTGRVGQGRTLRRTVARHKEVSSLSDQAAPRLVDRAWFNKLCILLVAGIWGYSFVTMKGMVAQMPVFRLLALRNLIATLAMVVFLRGRLVRMRDRRTLALGVGMGLLGFGAYATQTVGLTMTTPGKSAFLTGCYCVMVPFLSWLFGQGAPGLRHVGAALVCVTGIALVAADGGLPLNRGDLLSLADGIFYGLQFVLLSGWGRDSDALVVTCVEFAVMAACSAAVSVLFEAGYVPPALTAEDVATMLFLGLGCSCLCFALLNRSMTLVDPAEGSLLSSLEAPFGVLASVLVYGEQVTGRLVLGFALIFVAMVVSEAGEELMARLRRAM